MRGGIFEVMGGGEGDGEEKAKEEKDRFWREADCFGKNATRDVSCPES